MLFYIPELETFHCQKIQHLCLYHIFFAYSLVDEHLECFYGLAIKTNIYRNINQCFHFSTENFCSITAGLFIGIKEYKGSQFALQYR